MRYSRGGISGSRIAIAVVIIAILVVAAAVYATRSTSSSTTTSSSSTTTSSSSTTSVSSSSSLPNTLSIDETLTPQVLDPSNGQNNEDGQIIQNVDPPLIFFNLTSSGTAVNYNQPIGVLAKSWTSSANGETWTFYLRSGIYYSNGDAFNAYCVGAPLQGTGDQRWRCRFGVHRPVSE